jgi:hypothetical protein
MYVEATPSSAAQKFFLISVVVLVVSCKSGRAALVEVFLEEMNARPEIRDAMLVKKMNFWRIRAVASIGNCPRWKARKNYWSLVRRYPTLAAQHGFTATSIL